MDCVVGTKGDGMKHVSAAKAQQLHRVGHKVYVAVAGGLWGQILNPDFNFTTRFRYAVEARGKRKP
jgi:hypothetical protein